MTEHSSLCLPAWPMREDDELGLFRHELLAERAVRGRGPVYP